MFKAPSFAEVFLTHKLNFRVFEYHVLTQLEDSSVYIYSLFYVCVFGLWGYKLIKC